MISRDSRHISQVKFKYIHLIIYCISSIPRCQNLKHLKINIPWFNKFKKRKKESTYDKKFLNIQKCLHIFLHRENLNSLVTLKLPFHLKCCQSVDFDADTSRNLCGNGSFRTDRGKELRSRGRKKKGRKVSTTRGEIPESTASLRDTVYLNWGSRSGETRLGRVSAVCELLVARSRPQRRGALSRRRASLAAASRSIDRSLDRCRFDRRRGTSDLSRKVESSSRKFVLGSNTESCTRSRLNREKI